MNATVTTSSIETIADTPYHNDFVQRAKTIGGRWDSARRVWTFDPRDDARVRELVVSLFGTDGSEPEGDLVTVRIALREDGGWSNKMTFAGRTVAERPGRDWAPKLAANVVLVEGKWEASGGSRNNPRLAGGTAVVEIRDLPRAALSIEGEGDYEIVSPEPEPVNNTPAVDVDALLAEREALLARIAEIDAQLPEPEGAEATTRQAAIALGVSVRTVQRWAATGKVAARKDDHGHWVITITIAA